MVRVKDDLTGMVFGRLTVLEQTEDYIKKSGIHEAQWLCKCSCGKEEPVKALGQSLKNGTKQSCGCLQREWARKSRQDAHKTNIYDLSDEYGIGWTSNTNREFYFDLEDYDKIKDYCWSESTDTKKQYSWLVAYDVNSGKNVKMHQLLCGNNCDHKNRNTLDNRRANLRSSTFSENMQNRRLFKNNKSGVTGVCWRPKENMWQVYINVNQKRKHLGWCSDKTEAIKIRLQAEADYYKEFAPQKHLFEQYGINTMQNDLKES